MSKELQNYIIAHLYRVVSYVVYPALLHRSVSNFVAPNVSRFRYDVCRSLTSSFPHFSFREIGPAHFPSENGTYKSFTELPQRVQRTACCTGTPPLHLERNLVRPCYFSFEEKRFIVCLLCFHLLVLLLAKYEQRSIMTAYVRCHLSSTRTRLDTPVLQD